MMRKFTFKKNHLFLILFTILALTTKAQTPTYSYVSATSGNSFPLQSTTNRVQWIYLPSYFPTAPSGNITTIYIKPASSATSATFTNFTVRMGNTALSAFTSAGAWATGLTTVYSATTQVFTTVTSGGWVQINLQTPFFYSASSNFIVDISQTAYTTGFTVNQQTTTAGARMWGTSTGTTGTGFGAGLLNFGFDVVPAGPCVSPPTAGTTVTSATNACMGSAINLNLSGNTWGQGLSFQWLKSVNAAGPWTNLGTAQTTPFVSTTATSTLYYRCALTCGTSTDTSNAVQVTVPTLFPAGNYTINSALPTSGSNFHSFGDAVSAITCGIAGHVVFNVTPGSGPYNEQVTIPDINNSATKTVTFNGNGETLTYTNINPANYGIFTLNGADYIKIKRLTVVPNAAGTYGIGFLLSNDANRNTVDSCTVNIGTTITSSNFTGIALSGSLTSPTTSGSLCDSNTISNNTLIGGYYGLTIWGTSTTSFALGNQVLYNTIKDMYYMGTYFYYNSNWSCIGNDISRPTRLSSTTFYGIYGFYGGAGMNISKNKIHTPFAGSPTTTLSAYAIYFGSAAGTVASPTIISNNIIYDMVNDGLQYGIYNSGNGICKVYYNTIVFDNPSTTSSTTYGLYNTSSTSDVKNNIIYITRAGSGSKYCFYNSSGTITSNNNDFYITPSAGINYTGYYSGAQATLANWQSASSLDANSVAANPSFVSPSTGNLTPANLAINNLGTPVTGVTDDITGYNRSLVYPDMGAFEFHNCFIPTGLSATGITSNRANLSWSAISGAMGYEYIVDQSSAYPSLTATGTPITALSFTATGLNPLTNNYLHLRTKCDSNSYSDWVILPFKTCVQANISASGSTTFCTGFTVTLSGAVAPSSPYVYQWMYNGTNLTPGGTGNAITVATSGNYVLRIMDTLAHCGDTTAIATLVTAGAPPLSNITPAGGAGLCLYGSRVLHTNNALGLSYKWYRNNVIIPGATDSTYTATLLGSYTVNVSMSASCGSTTTVPTVLTTLPQPPALTTTQVPAICTGSTLPINANSGMGYLYQWYYNNGLISGATNITYNAANAGNYSVAVADSYGCKDTSTQLNLPIVPLPLASISPSVPSTGCDSLALTANNGAGYSYQWALNTQNQTGGTGITYRAITTGSYTVTVKDANNCLKTSAPVSVTINPSPASIITYTSPLTFCKGGAVALNAYVALGNATSYQWMRNGSNLPGEINSTTVADTTGSYAISVTNVFGCVKISSPVSVVVYPIPQVSIFAGVGEVSTNAYTSYQWFLNGEPIPGATSQNYSYTQNGGYYVIVTDNNGCQGVSAVKIINNVGIATSLGLAKDIILSPNPANDYITVTAPVKIKMLVKDMSGRTIAVPEPVNNRMSLQNIPAGIYMITILDNDNNMLKVEKLTKL